MVEKGGTTTRRSRRAASLTAQVLWNYQIEDDNNNNHVIRAGRKSSISKEDFKKALSSQTERGRKRRADEAYLPEEHTVASTDVYGKKKILESGCSGHIFSVTKPFQVRKEPTKKLTASVAPLVKTQPIPAKSTTPLLTPTPSSSPINSPHVNPILLLPVSLQANPGPGQRGNPSKVGGLSLVTLQAPPDFMNCFGFNKPLIDSSSSHKQWGCTGSGGVTAPSIVNQFNSKMESQMLSGFPKQGNSHFASHLRTGGCDDAQDEPLNLKMGETTIPSFGNTTCKRSIAQTYPDVTFSTSERCEEDSAAILPAKKAKTEEPLVKPKSSSTNLSSRSKHQRRKSRSSPAKSAPAKPSHPVAGRKSLLKKCPSPEYACSSPDADDVHREARHTCKRKQINLRHKAAPAPGTLEYEQFIDLQRRLLADAKQRQRAKAKTKAKLEAKKTKAKCDVADENQPISATQSQSTQPVSNGWQWTGKPYTCPVFSVDCGKYVTRKCYPGMTRKDKRFDSTDIVLVQDCVFLLASGDEELSYIGKVSALWEKPKTKEMMISLVWYYRPEHTEDAKSVNISEDELFSSRHQDEISVACVEERCSVLTYSQFCRAQAKHQRDRMWVKDDLRRVVPPGPKSMQRPMLPGETPIRARDMFYCRHYYDVLQKRVRSKLPSLTSLTH